MKLKSLLICAFLCLSVFVSAHPSLAQELQPLQSEPALVQQMLQEGWEKMTDGVLQRTNEGGQVETFTYGEAGLRWTARRLESRLGFLLKEYNQHPSEDLAHLIDSLKTQLVDVDQSLDTGLGQAEMPDSNELAACTISYDALASASPLTGSQAPGTSASASAAYSSNCGQLGNTYAYAYARATAGTVTTTKTQEDPKYNGTALSSAASATAPGSTDCYSEAYARAWSPTLNINYEVAPPANYSCPYAPPPFSVSVSGPSDVYLDSYYPCETVTWTATPSGGTPAFTYDWYIGGVYQTSGSSFSKQYCRTNGTVTVTVQAHDSGSPVQYANASYTTYFEYYKSCTSSCGCLQSGGGETTSFNSDPNMAVCP